MLRDAYVEKRTRSDSLEWVHKPCIGVSACWSTTKSDQEILETTTSEQCHQSIVGDETAANGSAAQSHGRLRPNHS